MLILLFAPLLTPAQDTIKFSTIHSTKDIPHRTLRQKWMWPHRCAAFFFLKERKPSHDTAYYSSYKGKLVLSMPISTRYTNFQLRNVGAANSLQFAPNSQYDVGLSINSKFASFFLNTGLTLLENDEGVKGKTTYKDYQFNLYGKKSTVDVSIQTYKGFYIKNSGAYDDFNTSPAYPYEIRPDVSVYSIAYNYYYIFNRKRFSYRSSFAFTEKQKRSTGSLLAGGYVSLFGISADSGLVSQTFSRYFDSLSYIKGGNVFNHGINVGYIYTFVIRKKFHATVSLVQGLGVDQTTITKENGVKYRNESRLSSKQNLRIALGYDAGKLFYGLMGMFDFYYLDNKARSTFNYSYGKFRFFLGYRFSSEKHEKKLLRKLNLIDYRL